MNITTKNIIFIFTLLVIVSACNSKKDEYLLRARFDPKSRVSAIILNKNGFDLDSITNIGSYYGKDSLVKKNNSEWDYYYLGRCGTGCSIGYFMRVFILNNKLNISLNTVYKIKEHDIATHYSLSKEYIPILSPTESYILRIVKESGKPIDSTKFTLFFDDRENIFYNTYFKRKNITYKGVKIDSLNFIYTKENKWKSYDLKSEDMYELE